MVTLSGCCIELRSGKRSYLAGAFSKALRDALHEDSGSDIKRQCKPPDYFDRGVPHPPLQVGHVGPRDTGIECEPFLRDACGLAGFPHICTKDCFRLHPPNEGSPRSPKPPDIWVIFSFTMVGVWVGSLGADCRVFEQVGVLTIAAKGEHQWKP